MVKLNRLVFICISWPLAIATFNWTIRDDTSRLSEVTAIIAREYLSKHTSTIVIEGRSLEPGSRIVHIRLLENLLLNLKGRVAVQQHITRQGVTRWEYYIFIVDSYEALYRNFLMFSFNLYRTQSYYLIVLTKYSKKYSYDMMWDILDMCYSYGILNANIIIDDPTLGVCMYTYYFYNADECESCRPVLIFKFSQGFENLETVFPQKMNDFHGCPMRVSARIVPPMMDFKGNISNPKSENLSGLEGVLLKAIAESLNFTIKLRITKYGYYNAIKNENADLAIGCYSGSDQDRWLMSQSIVYHTSPYVFIVREGQLIGSLARLAAPFEVQVWILIALVLSSSIIIIQVLRRMNPSIQRFVFGNVNDTPVGNLFAGFLGYTIPGDPQRNFARYLLMLWLILTLLIRSAYQGSLYDAIFMNKFLMTPSSLNELINWKYKALLPRELSRWNSFPQDETELVYDTDQQRLQRVEESGTKLTTVALRDSYMYYMAYSNRSDLTMINEVVFVYQVVIFFDKYAVHVDAINEKLQAFLYSGITAHFHATFNKESSVHSRFTQQPSKKPLTNVSIDAIYMIYGGMTVLALAVFVLELISKYSARLRRIIESLN